MGAEVKVNHHRNDGEPCYQCKSVDFLVPAVNAEWPFCLLLMTETDRSTQCQMIRTILLSRQDRDFLGFEFDFSGLLRELFKS
jgi:hypothetical protein